MTTTQPSFASVLHRLTQGEEVSGKVLLQLPGVAELKADPDPEVIDFPIYECIDYSFDQLPQLIEHAGRLAAETEPLSALIAGYIAEDLRQHVQEFGVVTEVLPEVRAVLWQVGLDADLAIQFEKGE